MPLDPDFAGWILEFILRQLDVEDYTVNHVFSILPVPSRLPLFLQRTILLRRLATVLRPSGSPSLRTLHTLELLDDLPTEDLTAPPSSLSESMTAAYCAVALHCFADAIRASTDENVSVIKACTENLRDRIRDLERAERPMLKGEQLGELRAGLEMALGNTGLETALGNRYVRAALMKRDTREEALQAVRVLVRVLENIMGPSFLEIVAKDALQNNIQLGDFDLSLFKSRGEGSNSDYTNEKDCSEMNTAVPTSSCVIVERHAGTATVGEKDLGDQPRRSDSKCDPSGMSEMRKVVNDLRSSSSALKKVVQDPLPDAARKASELANNMMAERINSREQRTFLDKLDANASSLAVDCDPTIETGAAKHPDGNCAAKDTDPFICEQTQNSNEVPKSSLMDRNPTAHTFEWGDDSIDSQSEGLHLPSPKRSRVSPLRVVDYKKYAKRRRRTKKWTSVEEDTLTEGFEKYGQGNWKLILNSYKHIFEERTETDLKDKWRNMSRYGVPK